MTIVLSVQPHVLERFIGNDTARAQGLVARFAYAQVATRRGNRRIGTATVPAAIVADWAGVVQRVAGASASTLTLSVEAGRLLTELQEQIEPRMRPSRGSWVRGRRRMGESPPRAGS